VTHSVTFLINGNMSVLKIRVRIKFHNRAEKSESKNGMSSYSKGNLLGIVPYYISSKRLVGKKMTMNVYTRLYPEISGLAAWSENCKWYSSLPLDAFISLFCESV
jgi:hypothetical protein